MNAVLMRIDYDSLFNDWYSLGPQNWNQAFIAPWDGKKTRGLADPDDEMGQTPSICIGISR